MSGSRVEPDDVTGWSAHGGVVPRPRSAAAEAEKGCDSSRGTWAILGVLAVIAFGLGCWGMADHETSWASAAYHSLQLFLLHAPHVHPDPEWPVHVARFLAAGVGFASLLVAFGGLLREQVRRIRRMRWKDHAVVCGLGLKGHPLVEDFREEGTNVVGIEPVEVGTRLEASRAVGAHVLVADADDDETLRQARAAQARWVFCTSADDARNANIALRARRLHEVAPDHAAKLTCCVHVMDQRVRSELDRPGKGGAADGFELRYFSLFDASARLLFLRHPLEAFVDVRDPARKEIHLVIAGLRGMGTHVLLQALRVLHFERELPIHVTVVDRRAAARVAALRTDRPGIDRVCRLDAVEAEVEDGQDLVQALQTVDARSPVDAVYVCFDSDERAFGCAVALRAARAHRPLPLFVRMSGDTGLPRLLDAMGAQAYPLRTFGSIAESCSKEVVVFGHLDRGAALWHENFRRGMQDRGQLDPARESHRAWAELPDTYRNANRYVMDHLPVKLRAAGCRVEPRPSDEHTLFRFEDAEVEALARIEHRRWCAERWLDGWTKGDRDDARRLHPDLEPWERLGEEARRKDRDAIHRIPSIAAELGLRIVRTVPGGLLAKTSDPASASAPA